MTFEYIAGFFDGEGHIVTRRDGRTYHVGMTQGVKQDAVLYAIQHFLHSHSIPSNISHPNYLGAPRRTKQLVITNAAAIVPFLEAVLPFLIVKRERAIFAIQVGQAILLKRRRYQEIIDACAVEYKQGASLKALTDKYKIARHHMRDHLKRRGIAIRDQPTARKLFQQTASSEWWKRQRENARLGNTKRWAHKQLGTDPLRRGHPV